MKEKKKRGKFLGEKFIKRETVNKEPENE